MKELLRIPKFFDKQTYFTHQSDVEEGWRANTAESNCAHNRATWINMTFNRNYSYYLKNNNLTPSYIAEGQITKNKSLLISCHKQMLQTFGITTSQYLPYDTAGT